VDPLEIERALVNLVINARDAMPGGGVVRIRTGLHRAGGELEIELAVEDEGPGIAEADRTRIFEPFYTTRGEVGGTGLGLATVLGTAEQHGGTVRLGDRPGGGSVFTIVLPVADSRGAVESREADSDAPKPRVRALEILVVDDEPMIAEMTRRILGKRGHEVRVATQPEDALRVWTEHRATIELVICDVVMARMRGPELIARMSALAAPPRVLFITGYSEEAVRAELGHPVLSKPFTAAALWHAVEDATR
jgi:CheY-like chemotaxis protein/anti-sigma regulatory factor (Ser/Thr protein kinase)